MPKITLTVSQKLIDRVEVLKDEHNARTGETFTSVEWVKWHLRQRIAQEGVATAVGAALETFEAQAELGRRSAIEAAQTAAESAYD